MCDPGHVTPSLCACFLTYELEPYPVGSLEK